MSDEETFGDKDPDDAVDTEADTATEKQADAEPEDLEE